MEHILRDTFERSSAYREYAEDGSPGACRENIRRFLTEVRNTGYAISGIWVAVIWDPTREPSEEHGFRVDETMLRKEEVKQEKRYGEHYFIIDAEENAWDLSTLPSQQGTPVRTYISRLLSPELHEHPQSRRNLQIVFVNADTYLLLQNPYPENLATRHSKLTLGDFIDGKVPVRGR